MNAMDWAFWVFIVPAGIVMWALAIGILGFVIATFRGWRP